MSADPVVTPWLVFPLAAVALLCVASHMIVLRELAPGVMPESRRRIRLISGWVMLVLVPMLAWGFGHAAPSDAALFAAIWTSNVVLLGAVVLMALLDALNTARLARRQRRVITRELARQLADARGRDG